jgi:integrase
MSFDRRVRRKPKTPSLKILSDGQLNRLLALLEKDPRLSDVHDVVVIVADTGLRAGELMNLRWADIDTSRRKLTISSNTFYLRVVSFADATLRVFEARRQHQPESEFVLGVSPRKAIERASHRLAALSASVGMKNVSLHSLRLTCLARLFMSGVSPSSIRLITGLRSTAQLMYQRSMRTLPLVHGRTRLRSN